MQSAGQSVFARYDWLRLEYYWDTPGLCHNPLYFEEANLERYGYSGCYCPWLTQPFISGARFFATVPFLPYLMSAEPPCETSYTLGHYRPGDCVPYQICWPPVDLTAGGVEAGVVSALIFAVP